MQDPGHPGYQQTCHSDQLISCDSRLQATMQDLTIATGYTLGLVVVQVEMKKETVREGLETLCKSTIF
jgi:hypothetical protein